MENVKAIKRMSVDNPPKPFWIIQEVVTSQGHTIEWQGSYSTEEAAKKEIDRVINNRGGK